MFTRNETRKLLVGNLQLGNQNKCLVQSMTNTPTSDIAATVSQMQELISNGCEIIRVAVTSIEDARAIKEIKKQIPCPIVADIHFDYRLALESIAAGVDKIRINPGNIGSKENVAAVVKACQSKNIPIRIGINSGSIEKSIIDKYGRVTAEGMIESAQRHLDILEELNFYDTCLSFKSSDVMLTINAYRLAAARWNYPLHLGVTEAGTLFSSTVKSSCALGALFADGIGDTLRISVSGSPVEEMKVARRILKSFELIDGMPELVSCPTCGRIQYDMLEIIPEVEEFLSTIKANIKVAVMGCAVNGPGEAKEADIAIAGGKNEGLLIKKGVVIKKVPQNEILATLKEEILNEIKKAGI